MDKIRNESLKNENINEFPKKTKAPFFSALPKQRGADAVNGCLVSE